MSSSILLQPRQFELRPVNSSLPDSPRAGLFAVRFLFEGSTNWQTRFPTYVSPEAQAAFESGRVVEVHLETLDHHGVAQKALKGWPEFVVMGVVLDDGTGVDCVPTELVRAKVRHFVGAAALAGCAVAAMSYVPIVAGLVLGLATQPLRTAIAISVKARFSARATRRAPFKRLANVHKGLTEDELSARVAPDRD